MDVITAEGLVKIYKTRKVEVRALDGLDPSEMEGHGHAPALWLTDFAELLDAGVDR